MKIESITNRLTRKETSIIKKLLKQANPELAKKLRGKDLLVKENVKIWKRHITRRNSRT